jgi:hypothetical protein
MAYPETKRPAAPSKPKNVDRYEDDASGINAEDRKPIDPRMPHMPPA